MKKHLARVALAALFYCASVPAFGQGTIGLHAFGIGKGPGVQGVTSLLCAAAQFPIGQASADPICQAITGDITIDATGLSAIGAGKVTNAKLGADVFSTAHTWSTAQTFNGAVAFNGGVSGAVTSVGVAQGTAILVTGTCTITATGTCTINLDKASQANIFAAAPNKGMTADNMYTAEIPITFGATTNLDFSTFINGALTLTGNTALNIFNAPKAGQAGQIRLIQDGTGSRTISNWTTTFKFTGGAAPTLSTAASAIDVLFYSCISPTICYASLNKDMR
jgi:hypothetical protein